MSLDWTEIELQKRESAGLRRYPRVCEPLPGGLCRIDGVECLNLGTNDYLGLAFDSRVIEASQTAAIRFGSGAQASALVCGRTPLHDELESALARFEHTEAALLFPSGFAANVGTICSLVGPGDTVFCDRLNHASLVDGCRLSGARLRVYAYRDVDQLHREILKSSASGKRLIVTDSLFSMDGDVAPLSALVNLAEQTGTMLLVDEAHATGVFGISGRGCCEEFANSSTLIRIGTLSKALASQGGFLAGRRSLVEWVRNTARTQMFSTGLTPAACGAALEALKLIEQEPQRRQQVRELSRFVRQQLRNQGWEILGEFESPILPLILGNPVSAIETSELLLSQGFFVPAIRPPSVSPGTSRLRLSLSASHQTAPLDRLIEVLRATRQSRFEGLQSGST